mgnify:FL=1
MKKTLIIIAMALGTVCCAGAGKATEVTSLARQYSAKEGFEVVSMGRLLISALGLIARSEAYDEDLEALNAFRGIKNLTVVDFEDAADGDKNAFRGKLEKILGKMTLILEAKDDEDAVKIYGLDDGELLRDIVIYVPDEAVISVKGSIAMENIGKLMEAAR